MLPVIVCFSPLCRKTSGTSRSFHQPVRLKTEAVTMPGTASGTTIRRMICGYRAPSTFADSISSSGSARMIAVIRKMLPGSDRATHMPITEIGESDSSRPTKNR